MFENKNFPLKISLKQKELKKHILLLNFLLKNIKVVTNALSKIYKILVYNDQL